MDSAWCAEVTRHTVARIRDAIATTEGIDGVRELGGDLTVGYLVIVGNNASGVEGSYGQTSTGAERPASTASHKAIGIEAPDVLP